MRKKFSNGSITIEVNSNGAELKSLVSDGIDYIWCSDPKYWNRSAPVLFPVIGKLKDLETYIDGKLYHMSQHGFLRDQEFEFKEEEDNVITYQSKFNEETLKMYPYKYQAQIIYTLLDNGVKTEFVIKNIDNKEIMFNIGGHPAFNCPLYEGEDFDDYSIHFEEKEVVNSPLIMKDATLDFNTIVLHYPSLTNLLLKKEIFYIDTIMIRDVKSRTVSLLNKNGQGVKFSFENFSTLCVWTPHNDAPFVCIEPWQGYNDLVDSDKQYAHKADLVHLKPNEEYRCSYTIELLK